ncbi:MAG TPA: pyridoxal-phosphate dependent enzyme [Bacillota bacterium]|nr:pyridoxal-phosphate dependent enzyme [Bacillota bacterium]HPU96189.1 pyridoxal-phosphate dependent enzyme [Bacillota bacterium]
MAGREAFFVCHSCGASFGLAEARHRCTCGGLLDVGGLDDAFSATSLCDDAHGVFRYRRLMPDVIDGHWRNATMAEGMTGLAELGLGGVDIRCKMDYAMPTLSFKDRGAAVLMAAVKASGVVSVVQDSSGNAGNSIAAYASRLGIGCEILVPEGTSPNKISQIKAYNATVTIVRGNREDTAAAALKQAEAGRYYASHVYNPMFYQGTKTYVYEIWEQMGGRLPEALAVPVGNGTLLLGLHLGLKSLFAGGAIGRMPMVIAVQAARCAPLYRAFIGGKRTVAPVVNEGTAAEGIAIAAPVRGAQMLEALREMGGTVVEAGEEDIIRYGTLLSKSGIFAEPTSAATVAGAMAWAVGEGFKGTLALPMCGSGLKSLH